MFERKNINPKGLAIRKLAGLTLYSHVVSVRAPRLIYISGQLSRNGFGEIVGKGDMRAQIEQVGRNLAACLLAANASLEHLVKTTTYTTDIDLFFKFPEERAKALGPALPTSATVEVRRLSDPEFMVEIEAVAAVDS